MLSYRSSTLLASTALALGAALVPASAFADTALAPTFTTADLVTALTAAEPPTTAAAKAGWNAQGSSAEAGAAPVAMQAIYAVDLGSAGVGGSSTLVEAQHSGTYMTLSSLGAAVPTKRVLQAINRPHASWIFVPDASLDMRNTDSESAIAQIAPDLALASIVDPAQSTLTGTPSETVAADGATTYVFALTDLTSKGQSGTYTLTVDAGGVVTAIKVVSGGETDVADFAYGAQHVSVPAAGSTITLQQFTEGSFLATMPTQIKAGATVLARGLTQHAHHHTVAVSAVRSAAGRFARITNRLIGAKVVTTEQVPGGARITGTNPFLHRHVAYTVTTTGKKAVAHRA